MQKSLRTINLLLVSLLFTALLLGWAEAQSAEQQTPIELIAERQRGSQGVSQLGADLFGDTVDLYTGALSFRQTDVSLPGNNHLQVAVARRFIAGRRELSGHFGDWDLDIPRITGTYPTALGWIDQSNGQARCSNLGLPISVTVSTKVRISSDFWSGNHISTPEGQSEEILWRASANSIAPTNGLSYPLITKGNWQIRCSGSLKNGAGEGFIALSPDGATYQFDWLARRDLLPMRFSTTDQLPLSEYWLMPTLVRDRFGNTVTYTYDSGTPWRLKTIASSDGRSLDFSYDGSSRVTGVSDGTRTWTYSYDASGSLTGLTLPDSSHWTFSMRGMAWTGRPRPFEGECQAYTYTSASLSGSITHPSGATGNFQTKFVYHDRAGVRPPCDPEDGDPATTELSAVPRNWATQALISKSIAGPGVPQLTWTYAWNSPGASYVVGAETKILLVTDSRGYQTRYTHGRRFRTNEGQLLRMDLGWNGSTAIQSTLYTYQSPSGMPYPEPIGASGLKTINPLGIDPLTLVHRPVNRKEIIQQGTSFLWRANSFDRFARVTGATKSSDLGYSKDEGVGYSDNLNLWVLNLVGAQTVNGVTKAQTEFNELAMPSSRSEFGRPPLSFDYQNDGTLWRMRDGKGNATTYQNYVRGLPQLIGYADGTTSSAVVGPFGQVLSTTNEVGATTTYSYDAMGRLASISHPLEASGSYFSTTQTFAQSAATGYGLEPGHWRQTITTGSAVEQNFFDALWRKRVSVKSVNGAVVSAQLTHYDADGRRTFQSNPLGSAPTISDSVPGTFTEYNDALGRVTAIKQSTDPYPSQSASSTSYLNGFLTVKTDFNGNARTSRYQAFDSPTEDFLVGMDAPEGLHLEIARDVFGKPLSIRQYGSSGGITADVVRRYVYDGFQRLCKTLEPETGATVQAYDAASNVQWRASGRSLPAQTSCDQASVGAGQKIQYGYDALNRLVSTEFGDGSPAIYRGYTADGLDSWMTSGSTRWDYAYNNRRLLTGETLTVSGSAYSLGWAINAYGHVSGLQQQGDPYQDFAPNALGQPTQISGYASGVTYHPNGAVAGYTLSNGRVYSLSQNVRGLPYERRDTGLTWDRYAWDANGNVASITDLQEGANSRSMGYDGLDRLTSASGPWGNASFGYDTADNLRSSTVGARVLAHNIDARNRLTSLSGSQNIAIGYDDNGNVTSRSAQGFVFDIGNRLLQATGLASYSYDGHGRRAYTAFANGTTQFQVYDHAGRLRFTNHSSRGATRYVYLGTQLIAETNSATGHSFAHTDALGSPIARSDATGALLSRTRYEPYGATHSGTNPTTIGFTGHANDADTGLVYMQQRYYDPIAGRFMSVDPVTTDANTGAMFDRYMYANNNPYRYTGLYAVSCGTQQSHLAPAGLNG